MRWIGNDLLNIGEIGMHINPLLDMLRVTIAFNDIELRDDNPDHHWAIVVFQGSTRFGKNTRILYNTARIKPIGGSISAGDISSFAQADMGLAYEVIGNQHDSALTNSTLSGTPRCGTTQR